MFVNRTNQDVIFESIKGKYITTILGARRVGKSFLVIEYINRHKQHPWVLLNMDELAMREEVVRGNLVRIIEESVRFPLGSRKIWVVIDEAQKCPEIFDQVKILYDRFKNQGDMIKIILTGSGYLYLQHLATETLAGRIELFYLREFGLQEALAFNYQENTPLTPTLSLACDQKDFLAVEKNIRLIAPLRKIAIESIETLLIYGGFPEVLAETTAEQRKRYLSNYLQTYLEKDVRDIKTIENLDLYKKLMEIIAEQTGSIRQDIRLLTALSCNRDTLKKYRGYLIATLIYQEIYPFIGSSLKRIVKSPKGYLLNNGLISYLTGLDNLEILKKTGLVGYRFENWFLNELLIWIDQAADRSNISYWRTSAGVEVDFIVEKKPHIFPFEVSYTTTVQANKIKNLLRFLAEEPRAKVGYYIYLGDYSYDPTTRICCLPAWAIV